MTWETILQSIKHRPIGDIEFFFDLYTQGKEDKVFDYIRQEQIQKEEEERIAYMDMLEDQANKWGEQ